MMICVGIDVNTAYAVIIDRPCSVQVSSLNQLLPAVMYDDEKPRANPDGTLYPGDATHFLFRFSGTDTCMSFQVKPLVSSENLTFRSALIVSDDNSTPKSHSVIMYKWIPKYLKTYHYYKILKSETSCIVHAGGTRACSTNETLSENPVLSIREDIQPTNRESSIIKNSSSCNSFCLRSVITESWHLVRENVSYNIGLDKHVFEDKGSVDAFISIVKSNCSNLSENHGCVFGHIEVNTDIDRRKQICLFEELDRLGIQYDKSKETDQCVDKDNENKISISVQGTGRKCDNDGKCKTYKKTNSAYVTHHILYPYGEILFKYLQLPDPDGFPSKNNDGTYYLDNAIGLHAIPDAPFKEIRNGIISFNGEITLNPLQEIDFAACNKMCNYTLSGENRMSPSTYTIENGDMLSAHFTPDLFGISYIVHVAEMYNLDRHIGIYTGTADPLIVIYKPQITQTSTWSRLGDAGYQSFDNRYAIAVNYTGSLGGGPDDGDSKTIHPDRPVKITDVFGAYFMSNSFGVHVFDWIPNGIISDAQGLDDLTVHKSIYSYIPANHTFVDTFENPATVHWNATVQDVMIDSAGYARILRDVDVSQERLKTYNINVTSYDTLISRNYGGVSMDYLASEKYDFPWGYFSTPLNVTAFFTSSENMTSLQDTDVTINHIKSSDADNNNRSVFVSAVEFYLNKHHHNAHEFAYMHMADLYDMNPKISFDGGGDSDNNNNNNTVLILLNKTGIHYDVTAYNKALENNLLGIDFQPISRKDVINMSEREFFIESSYYDVEISASRDGITKINIIPMGGTGLSNIIKHKINMHPQNHLSVNKINGIAMVAPNPYFGKIQELFVMGENADSVTTCRTDGSCIVFLNDNNNDRSNIEISVTNMWGGIATAKNVTSPDIRSYDPELWIDVAPMRLFWIALALAIGYGVYRVLRLLYNNSRS